MKTYLQYDGLTVLAHRGGADESFENTLESFDYSKSLGCKFIETDVQVSADGIPTSINSSKARARACLRLMPKCNCKISAIFQ